MHEDGSGPVAGLKHETWTTLYAGGRVSIQRQLKTGASTVNLANFGGKAIDVSTAAGWYGIYSGGPGDTSLGSGTNTWTGNGSEPWVGFRQAGSGPGQSLGVGLSSWQGPDFGIADSDLRLLVGNVSPRSHLAQRTEGAVSLAANSTYSSWFGGWLSANLTMAGLGAEAGDYRNPGLSLSTGSLGRFALAARRLSGAQRQRAQPAHTQRRLQPGLRVLRGERRRRPAQRPVRLSGRGRRPLPAGTQDPGLERRQPSRAAGLQPAGGRHRLPLRLRRPQRHPAPGLPEGHRERRPRQRPARCRHPQHQLTRAGRLSRLSHPLL